MKFQRLVLSLTAVALSISVLAGCGGGGNSNTPIPTAGNTYQLKTSTGIPLLSNGLVGSPTQTKAYYSFKSSTVYAESDDVWNGFNVVPAIGNNYNDWVKKSVDPDLSVFKTLSNSEDNSKNNTDIHVDYYDSTKKVDYLITTLKNSDYNSMIKFTDHGTNLVRAIVYYKTDWSKWEYILLKNAAQTEDSTNKEVRHIKYDGTSSPVRVSVLFYRKEWTSNMNDVIQIWHTDSQDQIICVRSYNMGSTNRYCDIFTGITNLTSSNHMSTGWLFHNKEADSYYIDVTDLNNYKNLYSPALFDDLTVGTVKTKVEYTQDFPKGYPVPGNARAFYTKYVDKKEAVTASDVAGYTIDLKTLQSNF